MSEVFVLPWADSSDERIASTTDIKQVLKGVAPGSFKEFSLCYEAAFDVARPLTTRERYLLATYGTDYATQPDVIAARYDGISERAVRNVGKYAIVQKSPHFIMLGKLADPTIHFYPRIGRAANVPMGTAALSLAGRINTIIDDHDQVIPELTREFVDWTAEEVDFETRGTDVLCADTGIFERCEHYTDNQTVVFANEIEDWLDANPHWTDHVDNMMSAYTTKGINKAVAALQTT